MNLAMKDAMSLLLLNDVYDYCHIDELKNFH